MICFGGGEGKLRFQLWLLMYCLETWLPAEQTEPMDRFLKKATSEFVYGLVAQCSDFSL